MLGKLVKRHVAGTLYQPREKCGGCWAALPSAEGGWLFRAGRGFVPAWYMACTRRLVANLGAGPPCHFMRDRKREKSVGSSEREKGESCTEGKRVHERRQKVGATDRFSSLATVVAAAQLAWCCAARRAATINCGGCGTRVGCVHQQNWMGRSAHRRERVGGQPTMGLGWHSTHGKCGGRWHRGANHGEGPSALGRAKKQGNKSTAT